MVLAAACSVLKVAGFARPDDVADHNVLGGAGYARLEESFKPTPS